MEYKGNRDIIRWFIIFTSFLIVIIIIWNTYTLFQIFKEEERMKIELWSDAQKTLANATEHTPLDLPLDIISSNNSNPMICTTSDGIILSHNNIDDGIANDSVKIKALLEKIKTENKPIKMYLTKKTYQLVYYGDSPLLKKLKYYPIALLMIIFLFGVLIFIFYRASKTATQNKLWAGMAKETAHQIGTPLSSLIGWIEILKLENISEDTIGEIQKDISRLQTITDRFSKIGSDPILELKDIVLETKNSFEYLKSRSSKHVIFSFIAPETPIIIPINPVLHSWTIENLVKNAIDAMKGKGKLHISIEDNNNQVIIRITDTGKGIPKNQFNKVFEPGFTTKKRGWGLGLSLTKRIVHEYHKGKIKVAQSEVGKGTTMQVTYLKEKLNKN